MAGENLSADDPYEVLGLSRGASEAEAKQRARELLDKYDGDHQARTAINEAFEAFKEQPGPEKINGKMVVPLLISATPDTVEVNEDVTIRATNHADDPVSGAGIKKKASGKRLGKTDNTGEEIIPFRNPGTYTVVVNKQSHPEPDHEYKEGEVEVEVERQRESLSIDVRSSRLEVDETFDVRVVDSNGNPQGDVTVTTDAGSSESTTADGIATLTATRAGTLSLEASKAPTSSKQFTDAKTTVSVAKRQVNLEFSQAPSRLSVDDEGTFKVTDADTGAPVRGVTVSVGSTERKTEKNGVAVLPFAGVVPGTQTVTASKGDAGGRTYSDVHTNIEVKKRIKNLEIRPVDSPVIVGDPVEFKITADGSPVDGATVRSFGGGVDETDSNGIAQLTFDSFGKTNVAASKSNTKQTEYGDGKCSVDVERTTERLQIAEYESADDGPDIEAGDDVNVKVVTVAGGPVEDVVVKAEDGSSTQTDAAGKATVSFGGDGSKQLTVSKSPDKRASYKSHSERVDVKQRTKELYLESINASRSVSAGESVTFQVVDELGNELSDTTVYVKDNRDQRKETNADGKVTFKFDVDRPQFIEIYARPDNEQFDRYDSETLRVTP